MTVTLGDPDVYNVRSDLASLLGHTEATQNKYYHLKIGEKAVAAADRIFNLYMSELEERVVDLRGIGDEMDAAPSPAPNGGSHRNLRSRLRSRTQ